MQKEKKQTLCTYLQTKSANISNFNRKSLNRNVNKYKEEEEQQRRLRRKKCFLL